MRWTKFGLALFVGLLTIAGAIEPAAAQSPPDGRPQKGRAPYRESDQATGAVLAAAPDDQGNARFVLTVNELRVEKTLATNGDTTLRLVEGADVVTISMNSAGYAVERGNRRARFDPQGATTEDLDAVRAVLLGSRAVRSFRMLTAAFEARDEGDQDTPLVLATLVDGAIVQLLDGDSGAPSRIAKRMTRKLRTRLKPAKLMPGSLFFDDCVLRYEMGVLDAWSLLSQCQDSAWSMPWYSWWLAESFCELEWFLRSQQYIYQFMSCFAYPF
jgi:hypothetical protein